MQSTNDRKNKMDARKQKKEALKLYIYTHSLINLINIFILSSNWLENNER